MRWIPFLAATMVSVTLAGCAGNGPSTTLEDVFEGSVALDTNATAWPGALLVEGAHLEGQLGDGAWGARANVTVEGGNLTGPTMGGPEPLGGGGETTPLPPVNGTTTLRVRLAKAAELEGYTARFYVNAPRLDAASLGNLTPAATLDASETFTQELTQAGTYRVSVLLFADGAEAPAAVLAEPFVASFQTRYTVTGDVQPQRPAVPLGGTPVQWPIPREQMVDVYTFDATVGTRVTATTAFAGAAHPSDQVSPPDVDLGLYTPDGNGFVCSADQDASETVTGIVESDGAWSIQVGMMLDGCGGTGNYTYQNRGPVAYTLEILVG